jgi:hypothetical protein
MKQYSTGYLSSIVPLILLVTNNDQPKLKNNEIQQF